MKTIQKTGTLLFLLGLGAFILMPFLGSYSIDEALVRENTKKIHQEKMVEILAPMYGETYSSNFAFLSAFGENFNAYNDQLKDQSLWDQVIWDDYSFALAKAAVSGPVTENPWLFYSYRSEWQFWED